MMDESLEMDALKKFKMHAKRTEINLSSVSYDYDHVRNTVTNDNVRFRI